MTTRKTAYEIRSDKTISNLSIWICANDYYDLLIELENLKNDKP